jgi:hypothetical protein
LCNNGIFCSAATDEQHYLEWLLVVSTLFRVVVGGINIIWSGCWWYQHYLEWLLVVSTLFRVVVDGINII